MLRDGFLFFAGSSVINISGTLTEGFSCSKFGIMARYHTILAVCFSCYSLNVYLLRHEVVAHFPF